MPYISPISSTVYRASYSIAVFTTSMSLSDTADSGRPALGASLALVQPSLKRRIHLATVRYDSALSP